MGYENEECINCNRLPICMGPCIQRCYETREKVDQIKCPYKNSQYEHHLSSFVIDLAKQRKLI